jgi:cytochrome c
MKLEITIVAAVSGLAMGGAASAGPADDIIAANKCKSCHTATTTKKGPSWASVAEKYKGDAAAADKIVNMLKTGANDHDKVTASDADLKAVANVVLTSK